MCALWNIIEVEEVETKLKVISLGSIGEFGTPNVEEVYFSWGHIKPPTWQCFQIRI
jgi:LEA14-like dessication related protein